MSEITIERDRTEQIDEISLKEKIEKKIETIFQDNEYGFEAFVTMKSGPNMKRFILYEGSPEQRNDIDVNFKKKIQESIAEVIKTKFLGDDKEYDFVENVADNQKKFYVIKQTDEYQPFAATNLSVEGLENYRANERENVEGIIFRFERAGESIWAYQFLYQNAIPNRKGLSFHIVPSEGDVFVEMKKPLLLISRRVDILVIGDEIISDDTGLLQRNFGFQEFVKVTATKAVSNIQSLGLIFNMDKLTDYINRSKPIYAKKMMRIKNSQVLNKTKEELYQRVTTLPRWRDKFDIDTENKQIILNSYVHVENLIDLLDERYTRSDVTNEEYDTGAKKWIASMSIQE